MEPVFSPFLYFTFTSQQPECKCASAGPTLQIPPEERQCGSTGRKPDPVTASQIKLFVFKSKSNLQRHHESHAELLTRDCRRPNKSCRFTQDTDRTDTTLMLMAERQHSAAT